MGNLARSYMWAGLWAKPARGAKQLTRIIDSTKAGGSALTERDREFKLASSVHVSTIK
jgi:hypothetical protein